MSFPLEKKIGRYNLYQAAHKTFTLGDKLSNKKDVCCPFCDEGNTQNDIIERTWTRLQRWYLNHDSPRSIFFKYPGDIRSTAWWWSDDFEHAPVTVTTTRHQQHIIRHRSTITILASTLKSSAILLELARPSSNLLVTNSSNNGHHSPLLNKTNSRKLLHLRQQYSFTTAGLTLVSHTNNTVFIQQRQQEYNTYLFHLLE